MPLPGTKSDCLHHLPKSCHTYYPILLIFDPYPSPSPTGDVYQLLSIRIHCRSLCALKSWHITIRPLPNSNSTYSLQDFVMSRIPPRILNASTPKRLFAKSNRTPKTSRIIFYFPLFFFQAIWLIIFHLHCFHASILFDLCTAFCILCLLTRKNCNNLRQENGPT
jgi:hypothetical protein